ncbi:uncharacterized protein PHACADRAFT_165171 [Phanerochaete carnosa HHB-10118-sp]|uniref:Uncharacterized protein n=1 Tax=Phanerochaete carnosa (strain HHB-10118-sp) TaxID=650164 RepID=K5VKE8_PHACS|nr:uncharacterized protein PHACADRAFT_165171 [Phanerochaete carnosa HHB-10118-sp]EKM51848.1 hypothetical protein PHACADRAFT_165171 [Phanerochaete carnosa HHB-10118-sp]
MLAGCNNVHHLAELIIVASTTKDDGSQHSPQLWEDHVNWSDIQDAVGKFQELRVLRFLSETVAYDSGGGDKVLEVLEEEMIPYIEQNLKGCLAQDASLLFEVEGIE